MIEIEPLSRSRERGWGEGKLLAKRSQKPPHPPFGHLLPQAGEGMLAASRLREDGMLAASGLDQSANPRSRSLTLVLLRVLASTCLTITAQYSECVPSLDGSEPLTTTLYGGT